MTHSFTLGIVAVASLVTAALGFGASQSLQVFAPCRIVYRTPQAVHDSLACQAYIAINLMSALLTLAALVLVLVVAGRLFRGRTKE